MNDNDRALCASTARLLQAASVVAAWGLAQGVLAIAVLALTWRSLPLLSAMVFGAVALVGVLERYLAFRLRFDAGLFSDLAGNAIGSPGALDSALQRLSLRAAPRQPRGLEDRVMGARQLMQRHGMAVACQAAFFILALLTQDIR